MDSMRIIDLLLGGCLAMVTWWMKEIWASVKERANQISELEKGLAAFQLEASDRYARREDLQNGIAEIKQDMRAGFDRIDHSLTRVFERVDAKADKE